MLDLATIDATSLGKYFDHSVLFKYATEADIRDGCRSAVSYNCAAFYASSAHWLPVIVEEVAGSGVHAAAAISFPAGTADWRTKAAETRHAVEAGAEELDIVMNIGALLSGDVATVRQELAAFVGESGDCVTKVILEVAYLGDDDIKRASAAVVEAGADYVKTSTGAYDGCNLHQFTVMRDAVAGTGVKSKVAGVQPPRPQNAYAFLLAGADLIGTRAVPEIIDALDEMRRTGVIPGAATAAAQA
ncbi:MAG: deoxyribose-phosphate aldolase [Pseudonocardiales bacterium]|nr:deoxyribose-phosphate aldolase [Pseudonocardiales bacterium]